MTSHSALAARLGRRQLLGAGLALVLGCAGAERSGAPPPRAPGLPLPASLSLALRFDLGALNGELGAALAKKVVLDAVDGAARPPLFERCLARATVVWRGTWQPGSAGAAQSVVVMRGHFASALVDSGEEWTPRASGLSELVLDAAGAVALYRLPGDEMLVWAPRAEVESIERAVDAGPSETALRPPERGAVSVAAAPGPLLRQFGSQFPELAARFSGIQRFEAFAEPSAGSWRTEVSVDFETPERANEASEVMERLKQALARGTCAVGVVARSTFISRFEGNLRVQAWLLGSDLESVQACVFGSGCCA